MTIIRISHDCPTSSLPHHIRCPCLLLAFPSSFKLVLRSSENSATLSPSYPATNRYPAVQVHKITCAHRIHCVLRRRFSVNVVDKRNSTAQTRSLSRLGRPDGQVCLLLPSSPSGTCEANKNGLGWWRVFNGLEVMREGETYPRRL